MHISKLFLKRVFNFFIVIYKRYLKKSLLCAGKCAGDFIPELLGILRFYTKPALYFSH